MTESSTTHLPATCPEWCTSRPDHDVGDEFDDGSGDRLHAGPVFGALQGWGLESDGSMTLTVDVVNGSLDWNTPGDLRRLAGDAELAATWLERIGAS